MFYPIGAFTRSWVHKDELRLCTRKREALKFSTETECRQWLGKFRRAEWFTVHDDSKETPCSQDC